jgi:DHA2 family multidrug resistance protein
MRTLGGAIGIALSLTMLTQRTNLHFFRMAETLTAADPALQDALPRLVERFMARGMEAATAELAALQHLRDLALREANVQTFSDIFLLGALVFAATALLTLFVRRFSLNAPAE